MGDLDAFIGPNAGYVAELFETYRRDPAAVEAGARALFARWNDGLPAADGALAAAYAPAAAHAPAAAAAASLAQAIRLFGHLGARLDPLGTLPPGDPLLEPAAHGLSRAELHQLSAAVVGGPAAADAPDAAVAIDRLNAIYRQHSGYELAHVSSPDERAWLQEAIEAQRFWPPADPLDERGLLDRLTEVSAFERFLHRAYPGQTRFSVEGLGMLIPMLDELVDRAADEGVRTILLGMAHRGRLNVLAHVLGKPYELILAEFEGRVPAHAMASSEGTDEGWSGDVKYHAGGRRAIGDGELSSVAVVLAPNPSHLEFVNPVVEGMARAAQERRTGRGEPEHQEPIALAVLIHGDASLPGQGVVAETLNLSRLAGYRVGGTLHLIANNQLGFTTSPAEARSTLYASDLAKGFEIPVVHVNADDPTACLAAVRLAVAYRARFGKDFLVDLVGYRRWGHNEGDEPAFTQPRLYAAIRDHQTVREQFAADLVGRGVVDADEPAALLEAGLAEFQRLREQAAQLAGEPIADAELDDAPDPAEPLPVAPSASPPLAELAQLNTALFRLPDDFELHPKLARAMERRRTAFDRDGGLLEWGHAEALAFATLLRDGTPIRLSGQDAVRGTFSQRHLAFLDEASGACYLPLQALPGARASFEAINSPLSEAAALGFEYGYSVQAPDTLVLWEAQYGDFINGAQVIVDEFVVSGQAKWGLRSGLVLLLPHGWEGQGPDHSSGRLERFLQLAGEDNLRIANCTTAAQYYHLLRSQAAALRDDPRPLVVMTPKSLLRHPLAAARPADLATGAFQPLLDDSSAAARPERIKQLVLCSGKVWADLQADSRQADCSERAVARLELLYPFPAAEVGRLLARYSRVAEVVWLQEEPRNAGAWSFVEPRLFALLGPGQTLRYVGRPERASPAEGWAEVHHREQRRLFEQLPLGQR